MVRQYSVHLVNLDPTVGLEIKKSRPCVVLSPDKMNSVLGTVIIAPMTSTIRSYPSRVEVRFQNKTAVDESRLSKQPLGRLKQAEIDSIRHAIAELFEC